MKFNSVKLRHTVLLPLVLVSAVSLVGCAAIGTAVSHRNLETQTKMSRSIFTDPTATSGKTVFVQVRNTTDKPTFSIQPMLNDKIRAKGYRIVKNASRATYILQVNLLQVGMTSQTAADEMLGSGYGGTLEGVAAGAALGVEGGGDGIAGGIIGGIGSSIVDNAVKDVTFSGIVDIRLQQIISPHKKNLYKTRILTTADKVNLKFSKAEPIIEEALANSISGLF